MAYRVPSHRLACALLVALTGAAGPSVAETLPPGLRSAALLPGWTDENGNRVAALELVLEPGWKTYWRQPGETGIPPSFDWSGSENLAGVELHWPVPEVILSDGVQTLGYHDRLVLPFTAQPERADLPVHLAASVVFGLCDKICVPGQAELVAPPPAAAPDPRIRGVLSDLPSVADAVPGCAFEQIEDGVRLSVTLPRPAEAVAMELSKPADVWVSSPELQPSGESLVATADFVPPSGKPFALDTSAVVVTSIADAGATEYRGCDAG